MKKFIYCIILLMLVVFPNKVLAEGYFSASPGSLTIEQGSTKTFTITAFNAIGDATIRSENSGVASVNIGEWGTGMVGENETKTGVVTVIGKSVGTTKIIVSIDAATFDGTDLSGQTKTVTVKVVEKQTPAPQPSQPSNPTPQPQQPQVTLSNNYELSSLTVEGYEITKVDNNNFKLDVSNDVKSINVKATAEDSKAKVDGIGKKELKVGENVFEIVVTAENGAQKKIYIKVNRKDGYYLEDLDSVLKKQDLKEVDIVIKEDSKITKENVSKIKENNKNIRFNYYDENKKVLYSWTINGNKVRESNEFITTITYSSEKVKEIYEVSNYADGLYVNFKHDGKLPEGTKIKLYVGDKFENDNIVSVHRYNEKDKKLEFIKDNLKVIDGYIEFDIDHCSDYFVTMSKLGNVGEVVKDDVIDKSSTNIFMIIAIVQLIIIIGLVLFYLLKLKPNKNNNATETTDLMENNNFDNSLNSNNLYNTFEENVNVLNTENNIVNNSSFEVNSMENVKDESIGFNSLDNQESDLGKISVNENLDTKNIDLNSLVDISNKEER